MNKIRLVYIDDDLNAPISKSLVNYRYDNLETEYREFLFEPQKGYSSILKDDRVRYADVIVIDSQLFENSNAIYGKYTGEDLKLIIKKKFPYKAVIVITRNVIKDDSYLTIQKYNGNENMDEETYYRTKLWERINEEIPRILEFKLINERIKEDKDIEYLLERINDSLEGRDEYDDLTKKDLDFLIDTFHKLQEKIDG